MTVKVAEPAFALVAQTPRSSLTVAPEPSPQVPAVVTTGSLMRAMQTTKAAQAAFDKDTAWYGEGFRTPVRRWGHKHLESVGNGAALLGTLGVGALAGMAWSELAHGGLDPVVTVATSPLGVAVGCLIGALGLFAGALGAELAYTRKRRLPSEVVAPLRASFDAAQTPIEQAALAVLADRYRGDLDNRKVNGQAPRAVLDDIVNRSQDVDDESWGAGQALVRCFEITHDKRGRLRHELTWNEVKAIEAQLAKTADPVRGELRAVLQDALFDGEGPRVTMSVDVEARLYGLLSGRIAPRRGRVYVEVDDTNEHAAAEKLNGG